MGSPKFRFYRSDNFSIVLPYGISRISQLSFMILLLIFLLYLRDNTQYASDGPNYPSCIADVFRHVHCSPRLEFYSKKLSNVIDELVTLASPCSSRRSDLSGWGERTSSPRGGIFS